MESLFVLDIDGAWGESRGDWSISNSDWEALPIKGATAGNAKGRPAASGTASCIVSRKRPEG
jgi:hypothetical protein